MLSQALSGEASVLASGHGQKADIEHEPHRQAEHQNFYYQGEHVILTTQAGRRAILDDAIAHLSKNFVDVSIVQTYNALGDSGRPQHKVVPVNDGRIIVTGRKSSGMVSLVQDMLSAHFNMPQPEETQKVLLSVDKCISSISNTHSKWKGSQQSMAVSKPAASPAAAVHCGTTCDTIQQPKNVQLSLSASKEQKRPTCTNINKALFSRAITDLQSQQRSHVTTPRCAQQSSAMSDHKSATMDYTELKSCEGLKEMEQCETMCRSLGVGTDSSALSTCTTQTSEDTRPYGTTQTDATICTPHIVEGHQNGSRKMSGDDLMRIITPAAQTTDTFGKANSSAVEDDPAILYVANTKDQSTATACADLPNHEQCERKDMATGTMHVYERELLLELSTCAHATRYPLPLIVGTECEILIDPSMVADIELFHPSKHRLPMTELAMSNVYMSSYNSNGSRRPIELPGRKYSSDPRSWGDSSTQKRIRKPLSAGQLPELLYSESAYNCMESASEHASYCPEFDEVFKNDAKLVPGVAFTKRSRESQDDQLVRELLAFYEPQNY